MGVKVQINNAVDAAKSSWVLDKTNKYLKELESVRNIIGKAGSGSGTASSLFSGSHGTGWIGIIQSEPDYEESSSDWWEKIKDVAREFIGSAKTDIITNLQGLSNEITSEINLINQKMHAVKTNIAPKAQVALETDPALRQNISETMQNNVKPENDELDQTNQSLMGWDGSL